jgi:hypothetical protein
MLLLPVSMSAGFAIFLRMIWRLTKYGNQTFVSYLRNVDVGIEKTSAQSC